MHRASANGEQYHIACRRGDLAEYFLVPGDPERVDKIAKLWDSAKKVSDHREFRSLTGKYKGIPVSALSSGIGPACMSIAVNEAASVGVHTFIRVGSTVAIQENIECRDLIFSSAAVRLDGTSNCYIMPEYPAVASFEVLQALIEAAESLGIKNYPVGITATTADFYAGQSRHTTASYQSSTENLLSLLKRAKVLNFEMETATLFTLASLYGLRAGSVYAVFANRCRNEFRTGAGEENAIMVASETIKILREWDKKKMHEEKRWLFPSLVNTR